MKIICERIKSLRIENNKTQKEIADYLKIDRSNYSKYELGKLEINLDMLVLIAKFFEVSTDYLLGLED